MAAHGGSNHDREAVGGKVGAQAARGVEEIGDVLNWGDGPALDQHEMQPDAQVRHQPRPRHGVRRGRSADDQARRAEDAMPMGLLDRLVDFRREAEIVGRDDEPLHVQASSRWWRNRKNSTPSRRRRFIISALPIISPAIEAIFDGRK